MPESVTSQFSASVGGGISEGLTISNVNFSLSAPSVAIALSNGSVANASNQMWQDRRQIASGTFDTINVFNANGTVDGIGNAIKMSRVKLLYIINENPVETLTSQNNGIALSRHGSALDWTGAYSGTITIPGGGCLMALAPGTTAYAVPSSTGNVIKVANLGSSTSQYSIVLLGSTEWGTNPP